MNKITISDKSTKLYELNKKLKVDTQNGFMINKINKLTTKFYTHLRYINVSYYLRFRILMCHRQFFRKIFQNREHISNFCNIEREQPFNYANGKNCM